MLRGGGTWGVAQLGGMWVCNSDMFLLRYKIDMADIIPSSSGARKMPTVQVVLVGYTQVVLLLARSAVCMLITHLLIKHKKWGWGCTTRRDVGE